MHPQPDNPLARQEQLVVQEMPDEVLVYDLSQHKAHCLNQAAAFVWHHCDGQTTTAKIAELMEQEWHRSVSEDVVWLALGQLSKAGLLQERLVKPRGEVNASRRALLHKLGVTAVTLPLVISIVAPTAMAGGSVVIPPMCVPCTSFGSGAHRANTCPPVCDQSVPGTCYNNSSCNTGQGGLLASNVSCPDCFNNFSTSSGWRSV